MLLIVVLVFFISGIRFHIVNQRLGRLDLGSEKSGDVLQVKACVLGVGHWPIDLLLKGGNPAAPSGTATLLRLSPSQRSCFRR